LIKPSLLAGAALCFALNAAKPHLDPRDFCQIMYYWEIIVSMYLSGRSPLEVKAISEDIMERFSFIKHKQGKKLQSLFSLNIAKHIPEYEKI
jgi:hypothetical protein